MPQKTKKSVSPQRSTKESSLATDSYMPVSQPTKPSFFSLKNNRFVKVVIGVVLLAIILGFLARRYKSALIVASVNGTPVLRAELNERLTNRFGSQMLEALIGERLITQEAAKQNIQISNEEVTAKIAEIEKSVSGSMSLDDSLKLQGITKDEFKNQVRIQLAIDKMFTQNATTSTAEVDDFKIHPW